MVNVSNIGLAWWGKPPPTRGTRHAVPRYPLCGELPATPPSPHLAQFPSSANAPPGAFSFCAPLFPFPASIMNKIPIIAVALCLDIAPAFAQHIELTATDSHAMLYSNNLEFSSKNVPIVRMRITDGIDVLNFTPETAFDVLPTGRGGAKMHLPGNRQYTVQIRDAKRGAYQYGAILARAEVPTTFPEAEAYCAEHKIGTEVVSIGATFAIRGTVFGNRENLLLTRRSESIDEVRQAQKTVRLPEELRIGRTDDVPEIYAEVLNYPSGMVEIVEDKLDIKVTNRNLLWFDFGDAAVVLHDIERDDGKRGDLRLSGQIVVTPGPDGKLAVVQSADVETLLRGILPAEIYASAPAAALEAQAIAARTTLLSQSGARHTSDPYHLCNRQHCQVYRGLSGADRRTDAAIEKTRGRVMASGSQLVQSYYSAHCGGISAGRRETWGLIEKDYLPTQTDTIPEMQVHFANEDAFRKWLDAPSRAYCSGAPEGQVDFSSVKHARWESTMTRSELDAALKKAGAAIGTVHDVEVVGRGASYRAVKLRVTGTKGTFEVARELPIRRFLGGLKSALFAIDVEKKGATVEKLTIRGAGFGHGVGLCQTGAIGMAQRGKSSDDILMHYFPNAKIIRVY